MKYYLASASPRRRELLGLLGIEFETMVSDIDEDLDYDNPIRLTELLSYGKAEAVYKLLAERGESNFCVIGSDTVVYATDEGGTDVILTKPKDKDDARRMIRMIRGTSHTVCTAVTICKKNGDTYRCDTFCEKTKVYVSDMSDDEIESYISLDEPYDKAGAYGIQGTFARFVEKIDGDYFNVVGLPVHRLYEHLK